MSLVALPGDSRLTLGPKSLFSTEDPFASAESSPMMFDGDYSSLSHQNEALSPESPGSVSSPSSSSYTSEQRELKRQRDRARRDSRLSARMRRYSNTSYGEASSLGSVDPMSSMGIPGYPSAPTTMSMLAETPSTVAPTSYISSYSPAMSEQSLPSQSYHMSYQQPLPQNYNMPLEYQSYMGPGTFSNTPRHPPPITSSQAQDQNYMYHLPSPAAPSQSSQHTPEAATQVNGNVRVVQGRPKPRCWEHGCNGRQFSTFSNLLRHQREKSGQASKSSCPNCGAEFTRTTARNGHMLHDKCKRRSTASS